MVFTVEISGIKKKYFINCRDLFLQNFTIRNPYFLRSSSSQVKQLRLTPCQNKNWPDKKRQWHQLYPICSVRNHSFSITMHYTNNKFHIGRQNIFIGRKFCAQNIPLKLLLKLKCVYHLTTLTQWIWNSNFPHSIYNVIDIFIFSRKMLTYFQIYHKNAKVFWSGLNLNLILWFDFLCCILKICWVKVLHTLKRSYITTDSLI